eukprot:13714761-Heterocapsa_arctica.AAC.1
MLSHTVVTNVQKTTWGETTKATNRIDPMAWSDLGELGNFWDETVVSMVDRPCSDAFMDQGTRQSCTARENLKCKGAREI